MKNLLSLIMLLSIHLIYCIAPLKVLFVTTQFPYQPRQYIDNQIAGLIDAGVDVHVLATKGSSHEEYAVAEKYNFKNITFYNELPENQRSYDIIYCQFSYLGKKMLEMKKEGLINGKIISCVRSGSEFYFMKKDLENWKDFFTDTDVVFVVCEAFKNILLDFGYSPEKIVVHHSAIDMNQFQYKKRAPKSDAIKLVAVGRLMYRKGHKYLIQAMQHLIIKHPTLTCDIYGEGPMYQELDDLIKACNLSDHVFLKGYSDHDSFEKVLDQYDIFVHPSFGENFYKEGIPNVLMEAMAMGFPVIGTYHSGIPELVDDNVSGLLVPEEDVFALEQAIDYLIVRTELWESFGKAAREKVEQEHCREIQNKKLLELFEGLTSI
jgi:colanic acid/amylovoran biosynthesis glycosyltransferase